MAEEYNFLNFIDRGPVYYVISLEIQPELLEKSKYHKLEKDTTENEFIYRFNQETTFYKHI